MTTTEPCACGELLNDTIVDAFDHVLLNLTKRCNQRCVFCFEGDRATWVEPTLEQVEQLLVEAAPGHEKGILMGGEALLRKDIAAIVRRATGLGLPLVAFTNGQALARDGLIEELVGAGLREYSVSCHYADAAHFARGTQSPPAHFERFLKGLENLARYAQAHPETTLDINCEILLYRHNAGQLADIRGLLERVLGPVFRTLTVKAIRPCPAKTDEYLLEPLVARRDELASFLDAWDPARHIRFIDVPLCLIPGREHLSNSVRYLSTGVVVKSNFADKGRIETDGRVFEHFVRNPYRFVCADCQLLALCPTARTEWGNPSFHPRADQRPVPFRDTTPDDVLRRLDPPVEGAHETVAALTARIAAIDIPERTIVARLQQLPGRPVAYAGVRPLVAADDARLGTVRVDLPRPGAPLGFAVGGLAVHVERSGAPEELRALLAGLAGLAEVAPTRWSAASATPHPAIPALHTVAALFGEALWPGIGGLGAWRTQAAEVATNDGVRLVLAHAEAPLTAELFLYGAPLHLASPPPPGAPLVRRSARVAAYLRLLEDRADDVLGRHLALEELAGAVTTILLADERGPTRDGAPSEAVSLADQAGALRVAFRDRASGRESVFFVARHDPRAFVLRRVGEVAIAEAGGPAGPERDTLALLLVRLAGALGAPPDAQTGGRWARAILTLFQRTPLVQRFECRVTRA